jgi:RNA polymerase sigma-70 factor (ECF subfamily)
MSAKKAQSEDPAVWFAELRDHLRSYFRRRVGDAVADDLLQDVFVKALRAKERGKTPENVAAWLYAIARNTVADFYRTHRPEARAIDEDLADPGDGDTERMHQELATCLTPFVQQLPTKYRDTLLATDLGGRTLREVADEHGVSLSAIKSRASRGRAMLKEKLLACCQVQTSGGLVTDFHRAPGDPETSGCDCTACGS